jgi:HPt (histidine-containing phosphotransfer) domain-containing protein
LSLLHNFIDEFGDSGPRVLEALNRGDRASAARLLHAVREAAGYIGAVELKKKALMLETAVLEARSDASVQLDDFNSEFTSLLQAISSAFSDRRILPS